MVGSPPSNVTKWRKRRQLQGFARVEVQVRKEDVGLVRDIASALVDPERMARARSVLRDGIGAAPPRDMKEYLASAPLEGIELDRRRDFGRDIDL